MRNAAWVLGVAMAACTTAPSVPPDTGTDTGTDSGTESDSATDLDAGSTMCGTATCAPDHICVRYYEELDANTGMPYYDVCRSRPAGCTPTECTWADCCAQPCVVDLCSSGPGAGCRIAVIDGRVECTP